MKNILIVLVNLIPVICSAQDSLNIHLLYHWEDSTISTSTIHGNAYNDVWGYSKNGREYAIIGTTLGAHFFDVTDPGHSKQVDFIPGAVQGPIVVHRDYHDYRGYLYMVCDEGPSTLQIVDLSFLPDSVHLVYDSDILFSVAHNIFIDSANAKLYVCGGANQLEVYSLANPLNPVLLVNCLSQVSFWPSTVGYVHDIFVRNDTAYCNAGSNGLWVVDFSITESPVLLGSLTQYVQQGYNHSGWLNEAGNFYAMADETHGRDIKLVNVTDPQDMQVIKTFGTGIDTLSIPHNLIFKGDYLFVSYYHDGFYIFNTCNPNNVTVAGYYDTSTEPHDYNYKGAWGVYPFLPSGNILISDMQKGLFVFDVSKALISIKQNTVDVPCYGGNDGAAAVTIENGNGGYSYSWNTNPPQNGPAALQLGAGTYAVTITDANSCEYISSVSINEPLLISISVVTTDVTTSGANDGSALLTISGGTPGYSILVSPGNVNIIGNTISDLSTGNYTVTATDTNGCYTTNSFVISEPVSVGNRPSTKGITISPNPFTADFSLVLSHFTKGDYFELIDVSGQSILHEKIMEHKTNVQVKEIPNGIYFLKIYMGGATLFSKVLKSY